MIIPGVQMPHCAPDLIHEVLLQRMIAAESFDRDDFGAFDLRNGNEARADRLSVDEHRARAALAFAAAFLRSGEPDILAQHVEQPRMRDATSTSCSARRSA